MNCCFSPALQPPINPTSLARYKAYDDGAVGGEWPTQYRNTLAMGLSATYLLLSPKSVLYS